MKIELSIDNRYVNLCKIKSVKLDKEGKRMIMAGWRSVEAFLNRSFFPGMDNLLVTLSIDDVCIFQKTKVRLKKEHYNNVFELLELFLKDKIYFYRKLEPDEITPILTAEYQRNLKYVKHMHELNLMMKERG